LRTHDRDRRILLSVSAGLAQRVGQILTALITLPAALHALGVAGFGVWGAATSIAWLAGMLDFGLGSALVTLVPQALAGGGTADARAHVRAALLGGGTLGVAILAGSLAALAGASSREAALPFVIAGVGLALNVPLSIAQNIWFGLHKGYVAGAWELLQSVLCVLLLLAAAAAGGSVAALVAAIYAGMVVANAGSLTHLLLSRPSLRPQVWRTSLAELRAVIAPGSLLFSIGVCGACAYVFDNILALEWLGPVAAAQMAVAMRVCTTAAAFLSSLTQPLWPAFVEAAAQDDRRWERRGLFLGTLVTAGCAVGGAMLLITVGQPALVLWLHADLRLTPGMYWAMAAWIIALGLPRVSGLLLNAVSILRFQLAAVGLAAVAAFGLKYLLAGRFGVAGIVAATPCAWTGIVWPSYAWRAWRWIARPGGRRTGRHA
jgi:O-antigen/teichoic acid export membrane protein